MKNKEKGEIIIMCGRGMRLRRESQRNRSKIRNVKCNTRERGNS